MIITRIQGGLGNQMFQYAIGRIFAEINKDDLFLDTLGLYIPVEGHLSRDFMLDAFNIKAFIASDTLIKKITKGSLLNNLKIKKIKYLKQIIFDEKDPGKCFIKHAEYVLKPEFHKYYPELLKKEKVDYYLDGYWQSYKFFTNYEDIIKQHFTIKKEYLTFDKIFIEQINSSQSVSLHVRLTDRVATEFSLSFYRYLDWSYYEKAIQIIKERIPNPHFFIFSDNLQWCKDNIQIDSPVTYVSTDDEFNDMYLMGQCKHHIIAHSTFSWWAVWLNYNSDKVVVTPEKWFNAQTDNLEDLLPEAWIKI